MCAPAAVTWNSCDALSSFARIARRAKLPHCRASHTAHLKYIAYWNAACHAQKIPPANGCPHRTSTVLGSSVEPGAPKTRHAHAIGGSEKMGGGGGAAVCLRTVALGTRAHVKSHVSPWLHVCIPASNRHQPSLPAEEATWAPSCCSITEPVMI